MTAYLCVISHFSRFSNTENQTTSKLNSIRIYVCHNEDTYRSIANAVNAVSIHLFKLVEMYSVVVHMGEKTISKCFEKLILSHIVVTFRFILTGSLCSSNGFTYSISVMHSIFPISFLLCWIICRESRPMTIIIFVNESKSVLHFLC